MEDITEWRSRIAKMLAEDIGGEGAAQELGKERVEAEALVEVLAFRLGNENFGFDIRSVAEILRPRPITSLPRCPEFIMGVVSMRGMILPVADTAARLGIGRFGGQKNHRVIVVSDGEERMGFMVDSVVGVLRFSRNELENTQYAASVDPSFLVGIGYDAKRQLVALLSTEKLCDFSLD